MSMPAEKSPHQSTQDQLEKIRADIHSGAETRRTIALTLFGAGLAFAILFMADFLLTI